MYNQLNYLIVQQHSAELCGIAERNRVIAGCEPTSRFRPDAECASGPSPQSVKSAQIA
jgi:hypothetical protein